MIWMSLVLQGESQHTTNVLMISIIYYTIVELGKKIDSLTQTMLAKLFKSSLGMF